MHKKLIEMFPEIIDYNHKTVDDDADIIKINAKIYSNDRAPVLKVYKELEEIKCLQSVSVKEIFD